MKRSINSEKLIVVTALAIAVSLLASACGPSSTRTLKTEAKNKTGKIDTGTQEADKKVITEEEKNKKAIETAEQIRKADETSIQGAADVSITQEFASRVNYIIYREFAVSIENQDSIAIHLSAEIKSRDKIYFVEFSTEPGAKLDSNSISFPINKAREVTADKKLSDTVGELAISAEVKRAGDGRAVVTLVETSFDDKKKRTDAEISALVVLNKATADVQNSKDANILLMKDANISTRTTQLYIYDESATEKIKNLKSGANRIIIDVKSKDEKSIYSLISPLNETTTSRVIFNDVSDEVKDSLDTKDYKMELTAGDAIIKSDKLALLIKNLKTKEESNVTLSLTQTSETATVADNNDDDAGEAKVNGASDKGDSGFAGIPQLESRETPLAIPGETKPDFSNVKSGVSTTEKIVSPTSKKNKTISTPKAAKIISKKPAKKSGLSGSGNVHSRERHLL